jgi:hypothetical protein
MTARPITCWMKEALDGYEQLKKGHHQVDEDQKGNETIEKKSSSSR